MPLAVGASTIPIIAFAPITINWFGPESPLPRIADRRGHGLLPGHGQHRPRPDERRPGRARADALVCRERRRHPAPAPDPERPAVLVHRAQDRDDAGVIGAVVGEFFGGPRYALGIYITLRGGTSFGTRTPGRRSCSPACSGSGSTSRSWRWSGSLIPWQATQAGRWQVRDGTIAVGGWFGDGTRDEEERHMRRAVRLIALAAAATLAAAACTNAPARVDADAHPGQVPAPVGRPDPVRGLLRGGRPGLLQGPRARRHAAARRPEHQQRPGRRDRRRRHRHDLAAEHAPVARGRHRPRRRSPRSSSARGRGWPSFKAANITTPATHGRQEDRQLARRQRAGAVRRADQGRRSTRPRKTSSSRTSTCRACSRATSMSPRR